MHGGRQEIWTFIGRPGRPLGEKSGKSSWVSTWDLYGQATGAARSGAGRLRLGVRRPRRPLSLFNAGLGASGSSNSNSHARRTSYSIDRRVGLRRSTNIWKWTKLWRSLCLECWPLKNPKRRQVVAPQISHYCVYSFKKPLKRIRCPSSSDSSLMQRSWVT